MYALVESESVTKIFSYPKGFNLADVIILSAISDAVNTAFAGCNPM